jgi:hypothetical protein
VSQSAEISLKAINERKDNYMILCSGERRRSAEMLSEGNITDAIANWRKKKSPFRLSRLFSDLIG